MSLQKMVKTFTGFCLPSIMPQLAELDYKPSDNTDQQKSTIGRPQKPIQLDAAKAVRRIGQLNLIPTSAESLTQLLNLPNIRVTNFAFEKEEEQEYLHLFTEHEYEIAMCPCCGEISTSFHDDKERSVRHLDIWGP